MSNYNELETLINEQMEQTPEKEAPKDTKEEKEPKVIEPEVVPPPPVPQQDESNNVKNKAFKAKINNLKDIISEKDTEIDNLKNSIREINKRHQLEKEAILAEQFSSKKDDKEVKEELSDEKKDEKKKEKKQLSSKKKIAIIVVVIIFIVSVIIAIFISKRRKNAVGPENIDSEVHDTED